MDKIFEILGMQSNDKENDYYFCQFERSKNLNTPPGSTEIEYKIAFCNKQKFFEGSVVEQTLPTADMCKTDTDIGKLAAYNIQKNEERLNRLEAEMHVRMSEQNKFINEQSHAVSSLELETKALKLENKALELKIEKITTEQEEKNETINKQSQAVSSLELKNKALELKIEKITTEQEDIKFDNKLLNQHITAMNRHAKDEELYLKKFESGVEELTNQLEAGITRLEITMEIFR